MAAPDVHEDDDVDFRCLGTLHGFKKMHHGISCIEIKCHHMRCTKGRAVAVLHYFSLMTGELVDTVVFQDISRRFKR